MSDKLISETTWMTTLWMMTTFALDAIQACTHLIATKDKHLKVIIGKLINGGTCFIFINFYYISNS
jgi:hypothetical protein